MYTVKLKTSKVIFMAFKSEKKLEKQEFFKVRQERNWWKTHHTTS